MESPLDLVAGTLLEECRFKFFYADRAIHLENPKASWGSTCLSYEQKRKGLLQLSQNTPVGCCLSLLYGVRPHRAYICEKHQYFQSVSVHKNTCSCSNCITCTFKGSQEVPLWPWVCGLVYDELCERVLQRTPQPAGPHCGRTAHMCRACSKAS